jgi:hypothetical protein
MPEFRNMDRGGMPPGDNISDEVVSKVGKAVGRIAGIRQAHKAELGAAQTDGERGRRWRSEWSWRQSTSSTARVCQWSSTTR